MEVLTVPDLESALMVAGWLQATGQADLFRGQVQTWPLRTTWHRIDPEQRRQAADRLWRLWLVDDPHVSRYRAAVIRPVPRPRQPRTDPS